MNQSPSRLKVILAVVALFVAYGLVGRMDYEDALAQEAPRPAPTMVAIQECAL